jgi:glycosyltransferase involved in cell wall biosynthesis
MSLKISIVTPSLNQGIYIKDTIDSVLNQNYDNFEHIIIDGGSTDNTIDILKKYPHLIWKSEKDSGSAQAINKGFKICSGDILCWINSDDYFEKNVFSKVNQIFSDNPKTDLVIGNVIMVDAKNNVLCNEKTFNYDRKYLVHYSADVVRQPSTFFRRKVLLDVGELNETLKLVFDYDLFIRMLNNNKPIFDDETYAFQRDYESTLSRKFKRKQGIEIYKISRKYGAGIKSRINRSIIRKIFF